MKHEQKKQRSFAKGAQKVIAVLMTLAVLMAMTVLPTAAAETAGDYTYTVLDDGTVEITGYYGSDTEIVIPSEIDGKSVTSIGARAFNGCTGLTSVTIPDSVTSTCN